MRRYYCKTRDGERQIFLGQPFEARGLAHPGNWNKVYGPEEYAQYGIRIEDKPDPVPEPSIPHVSTYRIVCRLDEAGKLGAVHEILDRRLSAKARFYTIGFIPADDQETIEILKSAGADPSVILARD